MEINTQFYLDTQLTIGIAWNKFLHGLVLYFDFLFMVFVIVIQWEPKNRSRQSITEQSCTCPECGWSGIVWDCEGDVDGDGSLGCPECLTVIEIMGE